jgi:putative ABC transport system permease protein
MDKNTDKIHQMVLAFKPEIGFGGAMVFEEKLGAFLRDKHNIHPADNSGIYIRNVADDLRQNQQFASVLQMIVTFVGLGTLMAGIIGISNIMVFVVKERTKELGIRKALGATPRDVIGMILQESIFITITSGYVGLITGVLILSTIGVSLEHYFIKNPYINFSTGIFATVILVLFGAGAGYIPARRAAKIKPIVALRDD